VEPIFFETPGELRAWFEANHATQDELILGYWKKSSGRTEGVGYADAVEEALCWGWIDGIARSIDAQRSAQRFTPGRKRSIWSHVNINRFRGLVAAGRVAPAGYAAFEARSEDRTGVYSFEQGEIELEPEMLTQLHANPAAREFWERAPKSYRKPATWWVISAKKPETRARRLAQLIEHSANGERVPPLRPLTLKK
jgi:uncharacterized protein YdeI (YjbR/CyaY-like superfamily)